MTFRIWICANCDHLQFPQEYRRSATRCRKKLMAPDGTEFTCGAESVLYEIESEKAND